MAGIELTFPAELGASHDEEDVPASRAAAPEEGFAQPKGFEKAKNVARLLFPIGCMLVALGVDLGAPNVYPAHYETKYLPTIYI